MLSCQFFTHYIKNFSNFVWLLTAMGEPKTNVVLKRNTVTELVCREIKRKSAATLSTLHSKKLQKGSKYVVCESHIIATHSFHHASLC